MTCVIMYKFQIKHMFLIWLQEKINQKFQQKTYHAKINLVLTKKKM